MTQITRDTILKLSSLSGLQLSDDEVDDLRFDIERIIGYVEQLDELDVEGVEPAYQVTGLTNVYRDDIVDTANTMQDHIDVLAPDSVNDQIKVPKVL